MSSFWDRLTSTSGRGREEQTLQPSDKKGAALYMEFDDCLQSHKYHVFAGISAVTIPWSYYRKSVGPFVVGMMLGLVPDLLYANYMCDDKYRTFKSHVHSVMGQGQAGSSSSTSNSVGISHSQAAAPAAHPRTATTTTTTVDYQRWNKYREQQRKDDISRIGWLYRPF